MPFILINKPKDWTSHDVVGYIRSFVRKNHKEIGLPTEARRAKVGHAGTLDPFATGLLIIGIERDSTRRLDEFKNLPKTYIAEVKLGAVSDTYDSEGVITPSTNVIPAQAGIQSAKIDSRLRGNDIMKPTLLEIKKVLKQFTGEIEQIPPMFSAKKIKGKKLYELARQGIEVERKANKIEIYSIKLLKYDYPQLTLEIDCSTGTYIRSLANDIGQALGVGAYCDELKRTKIGEYMLENAISPKEITKDNLVNYILEKADS